MPETTETQTSESAPRRKSARPFLEIQYHPGDIRRGVRYLFLSRRQVIGWCAGVLLWLAFVISGLVLAPTVISNALAEKQYAVEEVERQEIGGSLDTLVDELETLATQTDEQHLEMSKIYLTYGFSEKDDALGKGGYPSKALGDVPDSIFADTIRRGNGLETRIGERLGVLEVFLDEVQSFEEANLDQVRTTPSLSPIQTGDFVLTSPFGSRRSPFTQELDFHAGIDLAATIGTPIYSPADAVVTFAGRYSLRRDVSWWRYGNLVALRHGDGLMTLYGHLEDVSVKTGETVRRGQEIGTVGNTGWSTNPHLHYEVRRLGENGAWQPVDPRIYILNHRWRDEELVLIRARRAPSAESYEPLPRLLSR